MKLLDYHESDYITARLKNLGFQNYHSYLRSESWIAFKKWYFSRGRPTTCVACGAPKPDLHHKTYRRLGKELASDMVPLCRTCHSAVHVLAVMLGLGKLREATDSYIRVNLDNRRTK